MAATCQPSHAAYRAAAASVAITPEEPMWLAGYAARKAPSQGKLTELFARALAIQDAAGNEPPLIIVSLDLIAVQESLVEPVARIIREHYGVPRERLMFAASHTHYGPEVRLDKVPFFEIPDAFSKNIPSYIDALRDKLVNIIRRAIDEMAPATLTFSKSTAAFAKNRRAGSDEHDHEVPVLCARKAETQSPIAFVFGYACHNTTIDPQDRRWCGDWAGYAAAEIEAGYPGAVALFITGAAGDQNPTPRGTIEHSEKYGHELAAAVKASLTFPDAVACDGPIRSHFEQISLAFDLPTRAELDADVKSADIPRARKAKFLLEQLGTQGQLMTDYPLAVQGIDFGGKLLLISIGGEIVIDWATQVKSEYQSKRKVWVAGYCNDLIGYVPTRRIQAEGGYEAGVAMQWSHLPGPFTDDVEDRAKAGIRRVVKALE